MPKNKLQIFLFSVILLLVPVHHSAQEVINKTDNSPAYRIKKVLYGLASYYANKFEGRQTANGEIFRQEKISAACNILPLGTWIKVTNLKNGKSLKIKTNDRLHPKTRRLIDLSLLAARKLGYIGQGLTRVKIEVIEATSSHIPEKGLLTY